MKWVNHVLIAGSITAVYDMRLVPPAILGATAPGLDGVGAEIPGQASEASHGDPLPERVGAVLAGGLAAVFAGAGQNPAHGVLLGWGDPYCD